MSGILGASVKEGEAFVHVSQEGVRVFDAGVVAARLGE
jgi:hypothetical protein